MTTRLKLSKLLAVMTAAVATVATSHAAVVYQNAPSGDRSSVDSGGLQYGDQVALSGVERLVTEFSLEYFSSAAAGSAIVRFWANDGSGSGRLQAPGTLLYESPSIDLLSDFRTIEITGLAVTVPDTFTWTANFTGLDGGQRAELILGGNATPQIGSSFNDYWVEDGGSWSLRQVDAPAISNFASQVVAVPEPGVVSLILVGAGLVFGFRRSRRSS